MIHYVTSITLYTSDVDLEDKVLVWRHLEDKESALVLERSKLFHIFLIYFVYLVQLTRALHALSEYDCMS